MTQQRHILSSLACAVALILTLSGCGLTGTTTDFFFDVREVLVYGRRADQGGPQVDAFMTFNFENLKQDMAQGHGE